MSTDHESDKVGYSRLLFGTLLPVCLAVLASYLVFGQRCDDESGRGAVDKAVRAPMAQAQPASTSVKQLTAKAHREIAGKYLAAVKRIQPYVDFGDEVEFGKRWLPEGEMNRKLARAAFDLSYDTGSALGEAGIPTQGYATHYRINPDRTVRCLRVIFDYRTDAEPRQKVTLDPLYYTEIIHPDQETVEEGSFVQDLAEPCDGVWNRTSQ